MRSTIRIGALAAALVLVTQVVPWALAGIEGRYRITLTDKKTVIEGEVKELPDGSYEVKTKHGAIMTIKKNQVLDMKLQESATPKVETLAKSRTASSDLIVTAERRTIGDKEVNDILSGIVATPDESIAGLDRDEMMQDLPVDEDAVAEMKHLAGPEAKVLLRPHFVMVYTSSEDSARKLASRLESIWKWNVQFLRLLNVPAQRPEHKLEIYYFGTYKEFEAYTANRGVQLPGGALGYYSHDINRSHFFDLTDWPMLASDLKMAKDPNVPWAERQRLQNRVNRFVEFENCAVIQHEAGHHMHFNTGLFSRRGAEGGTAPTWLVEGTTQLFEVPPPTSGSGGASLGELNDAKLNEFRTIYAKWTATELKSFVLHNEEWYQGYHYPRGWALVYYMWKKHRTGLSKYIQALQAREGTEVGLTELEKEFEDCFGRVDDKWVEAFYKFMDDLQLRKSRLPPDKDGQASPESSEPPSGGGGGRGGGRRR